MTTVTFPTLETERLILRKPGAQDAKRATDFWVSERARFVGGHVSRFQAWKQFTHMVGHWDVRGFGLFAVNENGSDDIIGMVGPYFPDGWPEREIGWVLFDGYEGRGFALEAASATLDFARNALGWTEIVHYIDAGNDASVRLAERLGPSLDPNASVPNPEKDVAVYRQPHVGRA
jgi:RimJ/RimL family protein N-acetyltransferase